MSQSAGLRVSRAKRLHQAIGLQKTTMGEMILYLHTRQQAASKCSLRNHKLHINVQNRDFLFLWLKFCRFPPQDSRSASSQFLSLIPITSHNPPWESHQLQNAVPTLGAFGLNCPLVQTVPCSSQLLLSTSSTACVLSPSFPSAAPYLGKQQLCWKHGRTISILLPPICLGPQHSSGDWCRNIKASYSALKCSILNAT